MHQLIPDKNIWLATGVNVITIRQDTPRFYTHREHCRRGRVVCVLYNHTRKEDHRRFTTPLSDRQLIDHICLIEHIQNTISC